MTIIDLRDLELKINVLKAKIDLKELEIKKNMFENQLSLPSLWEDQVRASNLQKDYNKISEKINTINHIDSLFDELKIAIELQDTEINERYNNILQKVEHQTNILFLSGPFDQDNAILTINAGAGGLDAEDWAGMLSSMYQAFFKKMGWHCSITDLSVGDEGGVKNISMKVEGEIVYGLLKEEFGVHRLVRLSPFNSGHTRETSFAQVQVIPILEDDHLFKIDLKEDDLKWDYFMSGGKGGQSVNTTYSAVRLTHIPTNTVVQCQNERSQVQNKAIALKHLQSKLSILEAKKNKELKDYIKGDLGSNEWGSQIRNYILHPYKKIKDLRSGFETDDVNDVIENGNLLNFIWSVKKHEEKN